MVKLPTFDMNSDPIHNRGRIKDPGSYFIGLSFLYSGIPGVITGVGVDAAHITSRILSKGKTRQPTVKIIKKLISSSHIPENLAVSEIVRK